MNIDEIIACGETQFVEFKQSLAEMKEGCKALCGMLNTDAGHGVIIFGVSPTDGVVGLQGNLDSAQQTLAQHVRHKVEPSIVSSIILHDHPNGSVLVLSANKASNVPFYEYDGRAYIKEGSTKRQLSYEEKQSLASKKDRANHNGPWKCDRCGSIVGMLMSMEFTNDGPRKTYDCQCGGEYWPAT